MSGARMRMFEESYRLFIALWVKYWWLPKWEKLLVKAQLLRGEDSDARSFEMGRKAVDMAVAKHGSCHPEVAKALIISSRLYESGPMEEWAKAEPLLLRALEIQEKAFGSDDLRLVEVLCRLATFHSFQDHTEVADSLSRLAWVYRVAGRESDAAACERRAAEFGLAKV